MQRATTRKPHPEHARCQRFANSHVAAAVALLWGFAEATLFFLVPDIWIGLLALCSPRAGLRAVVLAVVGALVGGALMFGVGATQPPERTTRLLDAIPAISPTMIERVQEEMRQQGPASMLYGPLQGTPYKIYAISAGQQRQSLTETLLWTIPARASRFLLIALVLAGIGPLGRRAGIPMPWLVGIYLVAWVIFYGVYFRAYGF
jgi:membrane protein YqaA with SNARE-associated domain